MLLPYKGALVLGALAGFLVLERLFPDGPRRRRPARDRAQPVTGGDQCRAVLAVVVPVSAFAAQWALDWRPHGGAAGRGWLLDLLILDCWIYWWHRANHEMPLPLALP